MFTLDLNVKAEATTQYLDWKFNSMARSGSIYAGASSSGLFVIGRGEGNDGAPIEAYLEPVTTDFGISNPKKLRFVYLGFQSDGDLELEIRVDDKVARTYLIIAHKGGQQRTRVAIGRDGKGRYWSFRIKNTGGADFSVDSIKVLPIITNQGFI